MSAFDTAGTNWAFTFHFRECYTVSCKITQRKRHPNGVSDGWRIFLGIYALKRDRKERNVEIQTLKAAELKTAEYNPRRDLQPEDAEYQKLRQCMMLVEAALRRQPDMAGVITYCSIHSPQGPITAATARHFRLPCVVAYGGASQMSLATGSMPRLSMSYGARVEVLARSGRHNVLKAKAEALAQAARMFVVQYGINLDDYGEVLLGAVAEQVQNIPDGLDDLYITCGSGITASGVLVGIEKYGKNVKRVHLISTAYDRQEKVKATLRQFGVTREFIYHDLFHTPGFVYEKQQRMRIGGVKLHPQYEAKTMKYLVEHDLNTENALFWIVGAEPRER